MTKTNIEFSVVPAAETALTTPLNTVLTEHWDHARRYLDASRLFARADIAAQIMAGFELLALHEHYQVKAGQPKKNSITHDRIDWNEAVEKELGISEMTAWRWMEMAKVARPRLKKAGIDLADLQLLELNPTKLLPAQREALTKAVHKITDGKTQTEFLIEEGIMKVPQGGAGTGGKRTRKGEKLADLSPAEKEAQLKTIAIDYYRALLPALNQHLNERMSWQYLSDDLDAIVSLPMLRSVLADGLKLVDATLETRKAEALDRHRRTAATIAHTVEA